MRTRLTADLATIGTPKAGGVRDEFEHPSPQLLLPGAYTAQLPLRWRKAQFRDVRTTSIAENACLQLLSS